MFLGMDSNVEFARPCESVIGEYSLGLTPNELLMPLLELVTCSSGTVDTTFWDLENSHAGWRKRRRKHCDHIMTDLLAPTTIIAVFDDVIGATESDHLSIICVTNHPRLGSRIKGPMSCDAARVPRGFRFLRRLAAWAESMDLACATDVSRNEYGSCGARNQAPWRSTRLRPLRKVAIWESQRRANEGSWEPCEPNDMRLEAARPLATSRALGKLWFQGEAQDQEAEGQAQTPEADRAQGLVLEYRETADPRKS